MELGDLLSIEFKSDDINGIAQELRELDCPESLVHARDLVVGLCQLHFRADNVAEPFGPLWTAGGKRSLVPEDIGRADIELLGETVEAVKSPVIRARIADVLWTLDKSAAKFAFLAIEAYSGRITDLVQQWNAEGEHGERQSFFSVRIADLVDRGVIIARQIGVTREEVDCVRASVRQAIACAQGQDSHYMYLRILKAAYKADFVSANDVVTRVKEYMKETVDDFRAIRELNLFLSQVHKDEKDEDGYQHYGKKAAECLVDLSESHKANANLQATFLNDAILALRRYADTKERRKELHEQLLKIQKDKPDELMSFEHEADISDIVKMSSESVSGVNFMSAMRELFLHLRAFKSEEIEKEVIEAAGQFPLSNLFATEVMDSQGRVVFKSPGMGLADKPSQDHIKYSAAQRIVLSMQFSVPSIIDPIRKVVLREHLIREDILAILSQASPFVPAGHERIFTAGMKHFLAMDDLVAVHILVPQLENSLRHVLSQRGVNVDVVHDDGIQEFKTIHQLIDRHGDDLEEAFGKDIVYSLDLLFNFKGGPRVRSEVCHGLSRQYWFYGHEASYVAWFIIHLMLIPLAPNWLEIEDHIARNFGNRFAELNEVSDTKNQQMGASERPAS